MLRHIEPIVAETAQERITLIRTQKRSCFAKGAERAEISCVGIPCICRWLSNTCNPITSKQSTEGNQVQVLQAPFKQQVIGVVAHISNLEQRLPCKLLRDREVVSIGNRLMVVGWAYG